MANCEWLDLYPTAHVKLLPWIGSDHKPLLVDTESIKCNRKKQFRYMIIGGGLNLSLGG